MELTIDFGEITQGFEQTLTYRPKSGSTVVDGYVEENFDDDKSFKGVIVPKRAYTALEQGIQIDADSFLIVRLNQPKNPVLKIDDIVIDESGIEWKITADMDYGLHAKANVFGIVKVTKP